MYTLRCTRKLLQRIDEKPSSEDPEDGARVRQARSEHHHASLSCCAKDQPVLPCTGVRRGATHPCVLAFGRNAPPSWLRCDSGHDVSVVAFARVVLTLPHDGLTTRLHPSDAGTPMPRRSLAWRKALELFGIGSEGPVTVRTRMWH